MGKSSRHTMHWYNSFYIFLCPKRLSDVSNQKPMLSKAHILLCELFLGSYTHMPEVAV